MFDALGAIAQCWFSRDGVELLASRGIAGPMALDRVSIGDFDVSVFASDQLSLRAPRGLLPRRSSVSTFRNHSSSIRRGFG